MTRRVRLLGRPRIEDDEQPRLQPRGQKFRAVLARIALTERSMGRNELASELFAQTDDPLGALRSCLVDLRRSLDDPQLLRGDPVGLSRGTIWLDVWELWDGSLPGREIGGTLLDGVDPRYCPEFDTWLLLARGRCLALSMEQLRRQAALRLLATGDAEEAMTPAGRAVGLDPLDGEAQELFLRTLVAAGHGARALVHLSQCEAVFSREGLVVPAAMRAAVRVPDRPRLGVRAQVVATSLMRAGTAALDAGSVDAGIQTLRRAAEEAEQSRSTVLQADTLRTLGSALVHSLRGVDGEGTVVLHRALVLARATDSRSLAADVLRELAFADVRAGRHASADRALRAASSHAAAVADPALTAGVLAISGMNEADRGHHGVAARLLTESSEAARRAGSSRREAWSQGVMACSVMLAGEVVQARAAAERSIAICSRERWNTFLPWSQVLRSHCLAEAGDRGQAQDDAEAAFTLACELGDPCREGMAARALAMLALHAGDPSAAEAWIIDARRRCKRIPGRYVWISAYVRLAQLEIAASRKPELVAPLADRLRSDAMRADLPEFLAWALVYQVEAGDYGSIQLAQTLAAQVANPTLRARAARLVDPVS